MKQALTPEQQSGIELLKSALALARYDLTPEEVSAVLSAVEPKLDPHGRVSHDELLLAAEAIKPMPTLPTFQYRQGESTRGLHLEFRTDRRPDALIAALAKIGWTPGEFAPPPPFGGVATLDLHKNGSGLFNGWSKSETRKFVAEAVDVLAANGIPSYWTRKLTLADCL